MTEIRITKIFHFEMAHALINYQGLCQNIHGHSYKLEVTVKGNIHYHEHTSKKGMVMDFSDLKDIVENENIKHYDHTLILKTQTNPDLIQALKKNYKNISIVDYQPTSEQLLVDFAGKLQAKLPPYVSLYRLKLSETQNSFAEWVADDNK